MHGQTILLRLKNTVRSPFTKKIYHGKELINVILSSNFISTLASEVYVMILCFKKKIHYFFFINN